MTIRPVPKPTPRPTKARGWNSTAPMASKAIAKSSTRIRSVNPEAKARRDADYRKGMAAYRKSETKKLVEERSGGVCEYWTMIDGVRVRCDGSKARGLRMHHHHLTYRRFSEGNELPEDMQHVCQHHHDLLESQKPHKHGRPF